MAANSLQHLAFRQLCQQKEHMWRRRLWKETVQLGRTASLVRRVRQRLQVRKDMVV
eukprot:SAG31_NODE_40449_length_280_cov_2.011050_2_plen_55_part_01